MKKLTKLLALVLAVAMLLPVNALAAENEEEAPLSGLCYQWLSWDEDPQPEGELSNYPIGTVPSKVEEYHLAFFFCGEDGGEPVPVPVDELKGSRGVTIQRLLLDEKRSHYVIVSVEDWGEYTVSYNGSSITLNCQLPEIALYSKPEASTANFLGKLRYSPVTPRDTVYVGICLPEGDERTLENLELADFENKAQYALERYNDNFYKLTRKSVDVPDGDIMYNVTWKWPDGHTETWPMGCWSEQWTAALVSEEPVWNIEMTDETLPAYASVKDKVSGSLTLKAGEEKTVYLSRTYPFFGKEWQVAAINPDMWYTSDPALKLTFADENTAKYTVSCDVPGTYTIYLDWLYPQINALYHADGTAYTEAEYLKFEEETPYRLLDGVFVIYTDIEKGEYATFEELFPGERIDIEEKMAGYNWEPIVVTVTGEAAKPATETTTNFPDVKAAAWYAPAVAFASANGYMNGNADGTFNPDGQVKGSEFAQILHNKEGKPAAADGASFNGVTDQWYAHAILWAAGKGIITDTGDTAVAPTANLTRQQIALMLYNYMGKPAADADLSKFSDADKISSWALDTVKWAVSEGILKGNADGTFNPTGTAKRSETAQILMNFFG